MRWFVLLLFVGFTLSCVEPNEDEVEWSDWYLERTLEFEDESFRHEVEFWSHPMQWKFEVSRTDEQPDVAVRYIGREYRPVEPDSERVYIIDHNPELDPGDDRATVRIKYDFGFPTEVDVYFRGAKGDVDRHL